MGIPTTYKCPKCSEEMLVVWFGQRARERIFHCQWCRLSIKIVRSVDDSIPLRKLLWQDECRTWFSVDEVYETRWDCCMKGEDRQQTMAVVRL